MSDSGVQEVYVYDGMRLVPETRMLLWAEKLAAAEERARGLEEALRSIAGDDCTSYRESGRTCEWLGQKWPEGYCYPCIARAALTPPPEAEKRGEG